MVLGPQAEKIYPNGHVNNPTAQSITQTHNEAAGHFKDFMLNHKTTTDQFKVFFSKFDVIFAKLKLRDKALETFKHYFEKMRKLREDRQLK